MSTKGGFLNFNMQNSFVFYDSFYSAIQMLESDSDKLKVYDMSCKYNLFDIEPTNLSTELKIIWALIKPQFDANKKKRRNGALGGRPETTKKEEITIGYSENNHRLQDEKPNVNVNVNENENSNVDDTNPTSSFSHVRQPELVEHEKNTIKYHYENFMLTDNHQKNALCMANRKTKKEVEIGMIGFILHLLSTGVKLTDSKPDFQSHFKSWFVKFGIDNLMKIDKDQIQAQFKKLNLYQDDATN